MNFILNSIYSFFVLNVSVTSANSLWFILLCLLIAFAYSFLFYRKDRQFFETKKWKIYMLSAFRFVTVFFISFLLISPMLKYISDSVEKPILVFAQDNSESIISNSDSLSIKNEYVKELEDKLFQKLSSDFEIVKYTFGEKLAQSDSFLFAEKQTNMSEMLEEISVRYENRNLGAVILASDGIYNKGKNPIYSTSDLNSAIYTIALGDTSIKKDAFISEVKANKIAFTGNTFPIRIELLANKLKGKETEVTITNNGKRLFTKSVKILENNYIETIDAELLAEKKGLQQFQISVRAVDGEKNLKNNTKTIIVDVLDNKQKILILANSPHPDLGAIRSVLDNQQNYETTIEFVGNIKANVKAFDLIILHQLPSFQNKIPDILSQVKKENRPTLFILGAQTDILALNSFTSEMDLRVNQHKNSFEESSAFVNQQFKLFETSKPLAKFIENSAPLLTHFADYELSAQSEVFLYQKMKGIATQKPLILFVKSADETQKAAFIMGEGIWRWRLTDFKQNETHELFSEFMGKVIQYLALKVKKERFIVKTERIFTENQHVKFQAQVYNQSYEAVSGAKVSLQIKDSADRVYEYTFNQPETENDKTYNLNAGLLPIGEYSFTAKAELEKEVFKYSDKFLIASLDVETANLQANHKILYQLAQQNSGKLFYMSQLDALAQEISQNNKIKPIYHSEEKLLSFINFKWIFFLILILLTVEWFLRKFYGSFM